MSNSASTLVYRSFDLQSDLSLLISLLKDIEQADRVGEDITEAALHEQLTWSGQDPALNNLVVTLPGSTLLIGWGMLQKTSGDENADLYIAVHPAWRRQGIGSKLFVDLLERVQKSGTRALRAYVDVQSKEANSFVRKLGFAAVSSYYRLSASARQAFPAPVFPKGFTVRSYDRVGSVELYTEVLNRSYEGLWGHLHVTEEEVSRLLGQWNHAGIFLLFVADGTAIGTCRAELIEQVVNRRRRWMALIDAPGIVPEYRKADLYLPLLLTVIRWLLPQGASSLDLVSWGDAPGTLALYAGLSFSIVKEEISYRLDLA